MKNGSPAPAPKLQEIMSKPPAGFREATAEEKNEILEATYGAERWKAKLLQHNAELRAATLELQNAEVAYARAEQRQKATHVKYGILSPKDIKVAGGNVYLKVKPAPKGAKKSGAKPRKEK